MSQLSILEVEKSTLPDISLPGCIRNLSFISTRFGAAGGHMPEIRVPPYKELHSLAVYDCVGYPDFLQVLTEEAEIATLQQLIISFTPETANHLPNLLMSGCLKRLEWLSVRCQNLMDTHAQLFLWGCPNLKTLILEEAQITGVFVSELLKAPTCPLQEIRLIRCSKVSSDIILWAAARDVEVKLSREIENLTGHRVRIVNY